jgi:hypothetical protein
MLFYNTDNNQQKEAQRLETEYLEQFSLRSNESPLCWYYVCDFSEALHMLKTRKGRKIEVYHPPMQCDGGFLYHVQSYFKRRLKKEKVSKDDFDSYFYQLMDKKKLTEEEARLEIKKLKKINQDYVQTNKRV